MDQRQSRSPTPHAPPRTGIVIVNHDTREHLRACLETVPLHACHEVWVVDNASTDDSVAMVRSEFPAATVDANAMNIGYGAAANQGVRGSRAGYVLLLNSDTRVMDGTLDALREHLDENPRAAIAGPRLLHTDGTPQRSCFPFPGTLRWLLENDPVAPAIGWLPGARRGLYRFSPPTAAGPVPWVLGAALMIRRTAFEAVGGFDESFFMYYEEVDLCRRLAAAGWETHIVPHARAVHVGGASTAHRRARMTVEHARSTARYYRRYYRGLKLRAWLLAMRTKMRGRALRDGLALLTARDGRRRRLRAGLAASRLSLAELRP